MIQEFYIPQEKPDDELFNNQMHTGINFDKFSKIPVKVNDPSRNAAPKPIQSFKDLDFGSLLQENIEKSGYKVPTPIQKHGIPIIMVSSLILFIFVFRQIRMKRERLNFVFFPQGKRDLMACAQTGSGKTAAFLLPIIHNLMSDQCDVRIGRPYVVIVSPTRELAIQVFFHCFLCSNFIAQLQSIPHSQNHQPFSSDYRFTKKLVNIPIEVLSNVELCMVALHLAIRPRK